MAVVEEMVAVEVAVEVAAVAWEAVATLEAEVEVTRA